MSQLVQEECCNRCKLYINSKLIDIVYMYRLNSKRLLKQETNYIQGVSKICFLTSGSDLFQRNKGKRS